MSITKYGIVNLWLKWDFISESCVNWLRDYVFHNNGICQVTQEDYQPRTASPLLAHSQKMQILQICTPKASRDEAYERTFSTE